MAADGELSASTVKAAIFAASDDINEKFDSMDMTWGQLWQSFKNTALMAFQPVLQRINDIANSEGFNTFVTGVIDNMAAIANIVLNIFDLVGQVGGFLADNWSMISPIVYGVVAALGVYTAALITNNAVQGISNGLKAMAAFRETVHAAATMMSTEETFAATAAQYGLNAALLACPIGTINAIIQFIWTRFVEPFISIIEWVLNVATGGFDSFVKII